MTSKTRILGIALSTAIVLWIADAALDAWVFYDAPFLDLLILRIPPHETYVRVLISGLVVAFGVLAGRMVERREQVIGQLADSARRLERNNQILSTLRKITHLVIQASDRDTLLSETCLLLVENRGFHGAWITLLENDRPVEPFFSAGITGDPGTMEERLRSGFVPHCARTALETGEVYVISEPSVECAGCPHILRKGVESAMAVPLSFEGKTFGWLTVSLPGGFAEDPEEQDLLTELAGELGLGLWKLDAVQRQERLEESYAAVVTSTSEAVIGADLEGRISLFNPGAQRLFGYEEDEIIGSPLSALTPADLVQEQEKALADLRREGTIRTESRALTKDGCEVPVSVTLTLQRNHAGDPVGMNAILRDISRRIETELEYARLIDTAIDGFLIVDSKGKILRANQAMAEMLGYTQGELIQLTIGDVGAVEEPEVREARFRSIKETGSARFEAQRIRKDGSILDVEISATFFPTQEGGRIISFLRDISDRRAAEREIRESQQRFQMLFDNMSSGVAVYEAVDDGKDFIFRDINATGAAFSKVTPQEVIGRRVTEAFPGIREMGLLDVMGRVWRTGEAETLPLAQYRDGRVEQWVENSALRLPSGLVVTIFEDTTERRRQEQALRESEERSRELAELLPEAVFETDISLRLTYANRKALEVFGYSEADLREGISALDTLTQEGKKEAMESFSLRLEGKDPGVKSYTAVRKDGSQFPILFHASLILRNGEPSGLRGIIVDLTEQERAQEKIREIGQRFRSIVESTPMGMHLYELREDGSLVFFGSNPAADTILGVDNAGFIGMTIEEAFPLLRETEIPQRYREAARDGTVWRHDQVIYDEGRIQGAFDIVAFQTSPGKMAVMFTDTTDRRKAREALERSEERLRLATESGRVGVWEYVPATDSLEWDDLMYQIHGVLRESAIPGIERWRRRVHPEDLPRAEGALLASFGSEDIPFDEEFRIIRENDGEVRHVSGMAGFIRDANGEVLQAIGTNWDITESKEAREALRVSEERFRTVIEQSNDAIYILFEGRFDLVNEEFCRLTGVTPEETRAPEFSFWDLVAEGSRPLIRRRQEQRARGESIPDLYEFEIRKKSGGSVQVEASVKEIDYRGGRAVLGFLRDVTEQKALQTQLHQAQKMESIGRLSGGVAHDLNNLLTPIIGYAEILRDELSPEDERRDSAEEIVRAGFRSKDLVRQLLAFSRRQTLEFRAVELNALVLGFEKLLRRTIREDIEIRIGCESASPVIRADKGQLEQVLMNLAVNAQDAMPNGGTLHIETADVILDEEFARSRPGVVPGEYVRLSITDTGSGMDAETQQKIFEPFFTTKEKGHGTGLGLATVYGIVKQHNGNIWVYSEPGSGTTFKCYFPTVDAPEREEPGPGSIQATVGGPETIMVVEDEELVRKLAVGVLKRQGYSVLSARDGSECLSLLDGRAAPIDMLVTDVVLPGMNGRDLFEKVSERYPAARVLFMSGYSDEVVTHRGVLEEGIAFLQKPFSVHSFAQKVREVLDRDLGPQEHR